MVAFVIAAAVVIALLVWAPWDRLGRPHPSVTDAAAPGGADRAPRPAVSRPRRRGHDPRIAPRGGRITGPPQPKPRFTGAVRPDPNVIGLACGRAKSECTRGADCLCID